MEQEIERGVDHLVELVPAERADETELWDRNWERVNVTIPDEDFAAAVDVQSNIDAGAVDEIRIGVNDATSSITSTPYERDPTRLPKPVPGCPSPSADSARSRHACVSPSRTSRAEKRCPRVV